MRCLMKDAFQLFRHSVFLQGENGNYQPNTEGQEAKRRYYRLTTFGRRVAEAEAARLQAVIRLARRRRLAAGKSRP